MSGLAAMIRAGALIPVKIYGGCGHPDPLPGYPNRTCDEDEHLSYGLCDEFSTHAPGGSDCNRAEKFLLRPSDDLMADPEVQAAFAAVMEDPWP